MDKKILIPHELQHFFENSKTLLEVQDQCRRILNEQPDFLKIRILLSKLYYHQGYFEFAKRELNELKKHGEFPIADRIIKGLGGVTDVQGKKIYAEIKF